MTMILALCVAILALAVFAWLARARLRRDGGGAKRRRSFRVDLAAAPGSKPLDR